MQNKIENLVGKTLIFSDVHFGLKSNSSSRLKLISNVFSSISEIAEKNNISNIIFCGDFFHDRVSLNLNTMNIASRCLDSLNVKNRKIYLIVGNHDLYYKNSIDITSLIMFKGRKNIEIIDSPKEIILNRERVLLVPWGMEYSGMFEKETFDIIFGHFDISAQYLIASYFEEHMSNKLKKENSEKINEILNDEAFSEILGKGIDSTTSKLGNSEQYLGEFIEYAKKGGTIFAGHIHLHKEFQTKNRTFCFIGSPYEQNIAELGNKCGCYILDENNKRKFIEISGIPKHLDLRVSTLMKDPDHFDVSKIEGNIIRKIYDCEIDRVTDAKISQRINDASPYEEMIPVYESSAILEKEGESNSEISSDLYAGKSKLDYLKSYIEKMDPEIFKKEKFTKKDLFDLLKMYYDKVVR